MANRHYHVAGRYIEMRMGRSHGSSSFEHAHRGYKAFSKRIHSRPQSLRSFWPAAGIERLWEQPFQACAIDEDFVKPDGQNSVIFFIISKWLLPEFSIPAAGQKDRRLWGREWNGYGVVVWTGENDKCGKSFWKRCKTAPFSNENGLVWTGP